MTEQCWAKKQPRNGDIVLVCEHLSRSTTGRGADGTVHFFFCETPVPFEGGGLTQWFVVCHDCFERTGGDPTKISKWAPGAWSGDKPVIVEAEKT